MVGEDHSVSSALREKDSEIADLRARLDDKDRMLAALRSAARSRDTAEATVEPRSPPPQPEAKMETSSNTKPAEDEKKPEKKRTRGVDEMNNLLDEMLQDRVERGQVVRGKRGSVRLANGQNMDSLAEPNFEPLRRTPTPNPPEESKDIPAEA
jgi:centromeric protein E